MSIGHLHLNGFESHPKIKTRYPDGYLVFMARLTEMNRRSRNEASNPQEKFCFK